jgi:hypothetical protein
MGSSQRISGLLTLTGLLLCAVMIFMISSCEKSEQPVKPPVGVTQPSWPTNDEVMQRSIEKGRPAPRAPMDVLSCPPSAVCGPMDIAFLIDTTGSMYNAIDNVKAELGAILDCIETVSGGDYRMALVTFGDGITILDNFAAGNKTAVGTHIGALTAYGGDGAAEASDEAVNTVVNALAATGRPQNIDFTPDWRAGVKKILILVTDAPPGGFDDLYTVGVDDVNAHTRALEAAAKGINISAIFVPTAGDYAGQAAIMMDYATTTGGVYTMTADDGTGTGTAIIDVISTCGTPELGVPMDIKPGSCPNPLNIKEKGLLPVAILGTEGFDVSLIDPATVALEGVAPVRWAMEDVAAPYTGELSDCKSCWTHGADGYKDLTLKFDAQSIVEALGAVTDGDCLTLTLTGALTDGTPIKGMDIVKILVKPNTNAAAGMKGDN